mmetsp:Transcript_14270/g.14367  ORF Transcript_14270/g.14367 Transcript_14270/m.14367 type:complete len:237 (+) Transcript_14270:93-803(+)
MVGLIRISYREIAIAVVDMNFRVVLCTHEAANILGGEDLNLYGNILGQLWTSSNELEILRTFHCSIFENPKEDNSCLLCTSAGLSIWLDYFVAPVLADPLEKSSLSRFFNFVQENRILVTPQILKSIIGDEEISTDLLPILQLFDDYKSKPFKSCHISRIWQETLFLNNIPKDDFNIHFDRDISNETEFEFDDLFDSTEYITYEHETNEINMAHEIYFTQFIKNICKPRSQQTQEP